MDKKKWHSVKKILNIAICVSAVAYIVRVLWVIIDYKMHPENYETYSAPWYTAIIVASVFWGIVLLIETAIWLFARHKSNAGPIIERKDEQI